MDVGLYTTVYKEQFGPPGQIKRAEIRPTSAHRRNNPQPRPDFLFPRRLQPNYRSTSTKAHPLTPMDSHRPSVPVVRHVTFHSLGNSPNNPANTMNAGNLQHKASVSSARAHVPPSADRQNKLQLTELHAGTEWINTQGSLDYQTQVHFLKAQQLSGGYSCFLVVKPYQAGHYTIHPEFVSESLY